MQWFIRYKRKVEQVMATVRVRVKVRVRVGLNKVRDGLVHCIVGFYKNVGGV